VFSSEFVQIINPNTRRGTDSNIVGTFGCLVEHCTALLSQKSERLLGEASLGPELGSFLLASAGEQICLACAG